MDELKVREDKHEVANPFANSESFRELFDIGKMFATSAVVPANYHNKPMDCTIAVDMANRMGVSPMMVMQNLYVVQGKPVWSGQACMSLICGSGKFKDVKPVYTGTKGQDDWGCRIEARYKDNDEIVRGTEVTIKMAKDEKWYDKSGSKWKTMPEQMLAYRAAAFFARVHIPNALMGVYVEGEPEDITPSVKEATTMPFNTEPDAEVVAEAEGVFK